MNLLCALGIHRWRRIGTFGILLPSYVDQCARCQRGRVIDFDCTWLYTAEQMRQALAAAPTPEVKP